MFSTFSLYGSLFLMPYQPGHNILTVLTNPCQILKDTCHAWGKNSKICNLRTFSLRKRRGAKTAPQRVHFLVRRTDPFVLACNSANKPSFKKSDWGMAEMRCFISWIRGQDVQKLQMLLFPASCIASILNDTCICPTWSYDMLSIAKWLEVRSCWSFSHNDLSTTLRRMFTN